MHPHIKQKVRTAVDAAIVMLTYIVDSAEDYVSNNGDTIRFYCSNCGFSFEQEENRTGPNMCSKCRKLIYKPMFHVEGWIVGTVLVMFIYVCIQW